MEHTWQLTRRLRGISINLYGRLDLGRWIWISRLRSHRAVFNSGKHKTGRRERRRLTEITPAVRLAEGNHQGSKRIGRETVGESRGMVGLGERAPEMVGGEDQRRRLIGLGREGGSGGCF